VLTCSVLLSHFFEIFKVSRPEAFETESRKHGSGDDESRDHDSITVSLIAHSVAHCWCPVKDRRAFVEDLVSRYIISAKGCFCRKCICNIVKDICTVGNMVVNNLMFADDICVSRPSINGLQCLLNICGDYAARNNTLLVCGSMHH